MSKREKFAELRALRASGKKRLDTYQIEDQGAIYDEVDEEGYKKVVRGRLNEDDFVVDDKGEGYADDGREEWQAERRYYSSEGEGVSSLKSGAAKRKRENEKEKNENTNHKIMNYFNNGPPSTAPKLRVQATAEDEAFMADLLGEVDTYIIPARAEARKGIKSAARRKIQILSPPATEERQLENKSVQFVDRPPAQPAFDDGGISNVMGDEDNVPSGDLLPALPVAKAVAKKSQAQASQQKEEEEEEEGEDVMEVAQAFGDENVAASVVNMTASRTPANTWTPRS